MKVTIVPAQITTVEDRIAGNLGLSQLLLLSLPIFGGSALYAGLPPFMGSAPYKVILIAILMVLCGIFAIRIKGRIVLLWIVVLLRYRMRSRYYVYNKRSRHTQEMFQTAKEADGSEIAQPSGVPRRPRLQLSGAEIVRMQQLIEHPAADMSFETKKGGLYVRIRKITEVPEES